MNYKEAARNYVAAPTLHTHYSREKNSKGGLVNYRITVPKRFSNYFHLSNYHLLPRHSLPEAPLS